ncbi:MAG: hypothetical protein GX442_24750 [Candidatus Riflebacteria bacterium]|nr:hypothetical protein [Candidatus Riflebacteria bacterium]
MIDLLAYLKEQNKVVDPNRDPPTAASILPGRRRLVEQAQGAIRQHLEQQLLEAIRRFEDDSPPRFSEGIY